MVRTWCGALLAAAGLLLVGRTAPVTGSISSGTTERGGAQSAGSGASGAALRATRLSPADLEIGGNLAGLPPGATRYLTRNDLLALPQVHYIVSDDANFAAPVKISGVELEELALQFGAARSRKW